MMSDSRPRHLRESKPSGARNVNSPNGSVPRAGSSVGAARASVTVFEDLSETRRSAVRPRPCERSNFARTALIVKNVAGGVADVRTGGVSLSASGTDFGFCAEASGDSAQRHSEIVKTARSAGEPSFSNFWRSVTWITFCKNWTTTGGERSTGTGETPTIESSSCVESDRARLFGFMAYDSDPSALGRIASQRSSEEQIAFALSEADRRLQHNQNGKRLHQLR